VLKSYLKIAVRNIFRDKGNSIINISGLALGMACFILLILLVQDELSFDRFHEHGDDIYRVIIVQEKEGENIQVALTQAPLAPALQRDFPPVVQAACFNYAGGGLVTHGDKSFEENYFAFTDPSFFTMFSFPFKKGSPAAALTDPLSVVLSQRTAQKYFGDQDPMGKILHVKDIASLTVTGVIENTVNSHIDLQFVVSNRLFARYGVDITRWNQLNYTTYVRLQAGMNPQTAIEQISGYLKSSRIYGPETRQRLTLQPLKRIYLYSDYAYDVKAKTSSITLIYILSLMAFFILIIACINFMNLTTARSAGRMKEVGLRKVVGASRKQLILQFLGESVIMSLIALFFAVLVVELALPHLNALTFKKLAFYHAPAAGWFLWVIGIAIITGIIAGSYPAFFLSSFEPVNVLKGVQTKSPGASALRKILAIGQFTFSIILIIATVVLFRQLHFMRRAQLGYDRENLVCLRMNAEIKKKYPAVKNRLPGHPGITSVTACMNLPTWSGPSTAVSDWEGRDSNKKITMYHGSVDYDYFKTFKMDILEGRSFSPEFPGDPAGALIVNQEAVKDMELENPIGTRMTMGETRGTIIGVVKNYNFDNLRNKIKPLVLKLAPGETRFMIIRVNPRQINEALAFMEKQWKTFSPGYPFKYFFLDDRLNSLYAIEMNIGKVITVFTILAIFISSMGLFGLASFTTQQRTREVGIRKVFGASASNITRSLSREFLKWVLLANAIAWPVALAALGKWLQNYAYRIHISIWLLVLSGMAALVIVLATVSYQVIKTAGANPAAALRHE
jgi:ABC-type antimicrobial peptide transport system permease subunit